MHRLLNRILLIALGIQNQRLLNQVPPVAHGSGRSIPSKQSVIHFAGVKQGSEISTMCPLISWSSPCIVLRIGSPVSSIRRSMIRAQDSASLITPAPVLWQAIANSSKRLS